MKSQTDEEISLNVDDLSEFRTRQQTNLNHYKKATRLLNIAIKEIKNRIEKYKAKIANKEPLPSESELYLGFDWYIDQDEIWRFFIDKTTINFSSSPSDNPLEILKDDFNKMRETLKRCNEEKKAIKEELNYLDLILSDFNSGNFTVELDKVVKIDLHALSLIKEKYQKKFFNDFSSWKAQKLVETDIPNQINKQLDKIFQDDVFLFQEYETYDEDVLENKRAGLFDKINSEIRNYTLKELGDISVEKAIELIQIQLSVLLKFYNKYSQVDNNNNKSNEKSTGSEIEHRIVNEIEKKDKIKIKKWTGTKTEFARLVNEVYEKEPREYRNLKIASYELFNQYEFEDEKWTENKCYTLVRKT